MHESLKFANFIFQKCSGAVRFARFLCEIQLSLQSRAHFADLIFQKCSERDNLLRFLYEIELSRQSRAHFADLIFQKCPAAVNVCFQVHIALSLQSCEHFVWHFPRSSHESAKTETLLRRPEEPHFSKKHRVWHLRGFHPWIHTLPSCYTSQLLDDGRLTWWWGWHEGGNF